MLTFYLLFGIVYRFILLRLAKVWESGPQVPYSPTESSSVTVLIPFRNEFENLPRIYQSLQHQTYRSFQLIFIDDHSEDGGADLLRRLMQDGALTDVPSMLLQNEGKGKKEAIETGMKKAKGQLILTTDADCELPKDWIGPYLKAFAVPDIQLVAGPVMTKGSLTFLDKFQQIEWASILLVTHFGFMLKKPLMCSAANMGYRMDAFGQVKAYAGNKNHLSGDDEFLLKKISLEYGPQACTYLKNHLVWTQPEPSWSRLFAQRARWASKWRLHASWWHSLSSLIPFLVQLVFLFSIALFSKGVLGMLCFLFLWWIKAHSEKQVLGHVLRDFGIEHTRQAYFLTTVWHSMYVLFVGGMAVFGKIHWKGRKSVHFP